LAQAWSQRNREGNIMANLQNAVPENVPGEFFVDRTCIDCGTCRQLDPATFAEADDYSYVHHQPHTQEEARLALQALVCCPTGSIGTISANRAKEVIADFPLRIEENVFYNGFTSPKSYGASSYFIQHPEGNWLIDSPKFLPNLVRQFESMGGVRYLFLTHSDDVGEAERYAGHFGATRIIHRQEAWAQPETELIVEGFEPLAVSPEFTVIPTPGHTRGSCCLLYKNWALFTGDHLWWEPEAERLAMPTHYYWNQREQVASSRKLREFRFEWILPGHGDRVKLEPAQLQTAMDDMIQRHERSLAR
jgi:glyoxylase-like metal-dependent hydrolase (beta-lactamase superfamily II)/ferredoxin